MVFSNLTEITMSLNKISLFPDEKFCEGLLNLEKLRLNHNLIQLIPEHIIKLQSLTFLGISDNKLTSVPEFVLKAPKLNQILISGNFIDIAVMGC